jgi:hypothetical protein
MTTRLSFLTLLICCLHSAQSQTLPNIKFIQYAIWGGSAAPNSYKKDSGVLFSNNAVIQGNIGSNHLIEAKNNVKITGSLYSGNLVILNNNAKITGDIVASRFGNVFKSWHNRWQK